MRTIPSRFVSLSFFLGLAAVAWQFASADEQVPPADAVAPPISERYARPDVAEEPSFQKHVVPLVGRLGCNGRSCHGSFQGQGGFRLSLFGYDFKADHEALFDKKSPRVDVESPLDSLILTKPTDADNHEGGVRYKNDSWEHHVFRRWVEAGGKFDPKGIEKLDRLEITPPEIAFARSGEQVQLRAVAVWASGAREDVTPLCRFQSNSEQVAKITETGFVTATEPGDTHLVIFYDNAVVPIPVIRPVSDLVGNKYPQVPTPTKIDELVVAKLKKLGMVPSDLASDAEFLRRVSLDLTGSLPTAAEVEKFLADSSPNKRTEKIDELLTSPAYAAWWTTRLCDYTGNNEQAVQNANLVRGRASQEWYDWIYKRVADNTPYDELVEGIVLATSRKPGQSYTEYCKEMSDLYREGAETTFADRHAMPYFWARQNLRQPEEKAIGFAYTFLGIRIQCAQCHKHPFDQWSKDDFDQFKGFFTRIAGGQQNQVNPESRKEYTEMLTGLGLDMKANANQLRNEVPKLLKEGKTIPFAEVYAIAPPKNTRPDNDRDKRKGPNRNGREAAAPTAKILGGEKINLNEQEDARAPLMAWLRDKNNPYFARAFVNRVWSNYFNVGIVQPVDDLSLANPPSNKPLLDYLTQEFINHNFDMKWLHREITSSRTYQQSWRPNDTNRRDETNFSRCVPRRVPAEVAFDALQQATANDEQAQAMHEKLAGRAIALAGASAQRGANRNDANYALTVFGRSIRESNCDCDRSSESSLLQTVYLQNDRDVLAMIEKPRTSWADQVNKAVKAKSPEAEPPALVRQAYLRTVSRLPDDAEMARSLKFLEDSDDPASGVRGLLWALLNTKEFIVNH